MTEKILKKRFRATTYLCGAMENLNLEDMSGWRNDVTEKLKCDDLLIYDPVVQEVSKGQLNPVEQIKELKAKKQSGDWKGFYDDMWRIWFGTINKNTDLTSLLDHLRNRKHIDGNTQEIIQYWGDAEAVVRSDFIIVYIPKDSKMVGTIYEMMLAFLFRIPIYLIFPDEDVMNMNSSLLFGSQIANNGKVNAYTSIDGCVAQIKMDWKLP